MKNSDCSVSQINSLYFTFKLGYLVNAKELNCKKPRILPSQILQ